MASRRPQFVLPEPIDARLEQLLEQAREEGNRVSRSDIVATLIWHAPVDGDALGVMVRQYRRSLRTAEGAPGRGALRPSPVASQT